MPPPYENMSSKTTADHCADDGDHSDDLTSDSECSLSTNDSDHSDDDDRFKGTNHNLVMTGFLERCVNKEAPERFKEYVAYNVASHWDGAPSDQVFGRLVEYLADNPSNHGPLAPPPLDVRFAFVHSCDGLSGFAYSTIAGTDIDVDLDLAMKRIPGYVTPALRTAPDHLNFPYSHISGPWEFKDFPGNLTLTVTNSRQTVVDSWYNEVENRSEVMTHEALALNLLHKAVEELRIELQMHGTDHQFFCPRRWETVRLYEGCLDEGGTLECTTKLRVDVEGLCNWSKIMTAFGFQDAVQACEGQA